MWAVWQVWIVPLSASCNGYEGDIEPRIEDCTELISLSRWGLLTDEYAAYVHLNRGHHYYALRRFPEALVDANRATSLDPSMDNAQFLRARVSSDAGWFERARADFDALVARYPENSTLYAERGIVNRRLGRHDEALSDYGTAIKLDPDNASAYNNRAWAYFLQGRHAEALADAGKAVELSASDPGAVDTRAHILLALGRKEEALQDFIDIAKTGPSDMVRRYQSILKLRG